MTDARTFEEREEEEEREREKERERERKRERERMMLRCVDGGRRAAAKAAVAAAAGTHEWRSAVNQLLAVASSSFSSREVSSALALQHITKSPSPSTPQKAGRAFSEHLNFSPFASRKSSFFLSLPRTLSSSCAVSARSFSFKPRNLRTQKVEPEKEHLVDEEILSLGAKDVRVVSEDGEHQVMNVEKALAQAKSNELNLVVVNQNAKPPVCR